MIGSVWLLRHGEPADEARGRCYGSLDVELSAEGKRQAQSASAALSKQTFGAIYSSPRRRCREAARILAIERPCKVEIIDALAEIHFGNFEGRTYDEIALDHPDLFQQWMERPTEFQFPGGESLEQMWKRVTAAARTLRERHSGESIAIVTHGGVIRILLAEVLGVPPANIFRIAQDYGAINLIRYFDGTPVVEMVNMRPELLPM